MKKAVSVLFLMMALAISGLARADQLLTYEPVVNEVKGAVIKGKFQHTNGQWVKFWFLKLTTPAKINADSLNDINGSENGIREIQLYSDNPALRKKLDRCNGKRVSVNGTLFHEHTAWHVRTLVMDVQGINMTPLRKKL
jgi:hypothetical protein